MLRKQNIWRQGDHETVAACRPVAMPSGTVVVNGSTVVDLSLVRNATFEPNCDRNGYLVVANTNQTSLMSVLWPQVVDNPYTYAHWEFPFSQSSIPLIFAVAGSTVAIWLLFFGLVTSQYRRPLYLKLTALVAVATISLMSADVLQFVRDQYARGFTDGGAIQDLLMDSVKVGVAKIVATTCLLLQDVRTVVRLFARRREKRLIWLCGNLFVVTSTVLMLVDLLAPDPSKRKDAVDAIVVFGYLFSIGTALLFEFCIVYYTVIMFPLVLGRGVLLLTVLSNLLAVAPVVLFILDLVREDISLWMNEVNLAVLMGASISAWNWVDRLEQRTQEKQLNSVLGRQYYDEDRILDLEVGSDSSIRREKTEWARATESSDSGDASNGSNSFAETLSRWYRKAVSFHPGSSSAANFVVTSRSSNNPTPAIADGPKDAAPPDPPSPPSPARLRKYHHEFRR